MGGAAAIAKFVLLAAGVTAAVCAVIGLLVAVLGGFTSAPQSIGWAMAIGGGFMTMVVGESGSITHVMATGVTRTSYSFVVAGLLVAGLGVALIILTY